MASAVNGCNEHVDNSDESHDSVAGQQPRLTDKIHKEKDTEALGSSDEGSSVKRVTRARVKQLAAAPGSDSNDHNICGARKKLSTLCKSTQDKKVNNEGSVKQEEKNEDSDDSDSPRDYVHVQVGDCVMLDSGHPSDPYIALVSSVQTSQRQDRSVSSFMAQWYYKPYDVKEEVKALIEGGVLENEVFLSPHKDKNSIDAVIEVCQVVSPEEYVEIQDEIKRGFREKGKTYFICRYKYYPNRSNTKKALEVVENEAIRNGLGRPKPNIGTNYQANIPDFIEGPPSRTSLDDSIVPWKTPENSTVRPRQVWSPVAAKAQSQTFLQFRDLIDKLKFAVGNIVKIYRPNAKPMGHQRGIVVQYHLSDSIQICVSTGQVLSVLKSELCSPLTEDLVMQHLYMSRFNLSQAAYGCSKTILRVQLKERKAFRIEVESFAKVNDAALAKKQKDCREGDSRKRKK
ncbi:hypothetical protein PsorP6_000169 [Peronosclerospora sorghi]|uniref:Uncharacterized protein n=1 Tax=Peronosclerospora sorghi TaxID=230839 RepID=A0ACC0WXY6_9STRA|nr:hypothetical protein PsorP6_000169 [Peronosclerospora sorghi]